MARPHNQVSRLRLSHPLKILVPRVEFERARIRVLKTRTEIRLMNKVRTVLSAAHRLVLIPSGIHDRPPFLRTQQSGIRPRSLCCRCSLCLCLRARSHATACQACRERKTARHSPVELSIRLAHRSFVLGSCTGIVSLALRIHLGLGSGNGTCSERNWPYGQSRLAVEDRWFFPPEFQKWVRCSKFLLVHRNLDRCGVAEVARSSRDRE